MVRSLVGALLAVGEGRRPPEWPAGLLGRTERANDVPVAPAGGLTLVRVDYPADDELAARALMTRRGGTSRENGRATASSTGAAVTSSRTAPPRRAVEQGHEDGGHVVARHAAPVTRARQGDASGARRRR